MKKALIKLAGWVLLALTSPVWFTYLYVKFGLLMGQIMLEAAVNQLPDK